MMKKIVVKTIILLCQTIAVPAFIACSEIDNSANLSIPYSEQVDESVVHEDLIVCQAPAETILPEGTYTVIYEAIDPDQDNKKLADWKFEDVQVKQGKDKDEATTHLSSVNAKKI